MFDRPKKIDRNHLRDVPIPGKYCDVEGCGRLTAVYTKEYDVSRCAACYQRDLDEAGKSASMKMVSLLKRHDQLTVAS